MMKPAFKITAYILGSLLFLSGTFIVPLSAHEESTDGGSALRGICARLDTAKSGLHGRLGTRREVVREKHGELRDRFLEKRDERRERRRERRDEWALRFEEHFAKLRENAETPEQKQAVEEFVSAVGSAIVARHTAVDAAAALYHDGVLAVREERRAAIEAAAEKFKVAVDAAFERAHTDCDSGATSETVRVALRTDLAAARETLVSDLRTIERPRDVLEPLRATLRDAIKKANEDFKEAVEVAREAFKAAHDV